MITVSLRNVVAAVYERRVQLTRPSKPRNYAERVFRNECALFLRTSALFACLAGTALSVHADVGSNNPTGTSGEFNGNVTTGCSYDPFSANATRSITDLTVASGVGAYPLAFTRTMNSRYTAGLAGQFGQAGNWTHSLSWSIDSVTTPPGYMPGSYT